MWGVLAEILSKYVPGQQDVLSLAFTLADSDRLKQLFAGAGFREIRVTREIREGDFASFDDYWAAVEEGVGSSPQIYRALPESSRRAIRDQMQARLATYEMAGRLVMNVEMLIGGGRA